MNKNKAKYSVTDLLLLMNRLRDREHGCPWDVEQTFQSIKPYTIEEAYEVADAIERDDMGDLKDELGDLLFQIIFHAQIAAENGSFTFSDVVDHVTKKMIFRHPHVFESTSKVSADYVSENIWDAQKEKETEKRNERRAIQNEDGLSPSPANILASVTMNLPSLSLSSKIQKKVRKAGFAYPNIQDVFDKLEEEKSELQVAIEKGQITDIEEEYGDMLFVCALIGQHIKIDAEQALRKANIKFINRFNALEDDLAMRGLTIHDTGIAEMMNTWDRVKNKEKLS